MGKDLKRVSSEPAGTIEPDASEKELDRHIGFDGPQVEGGPSVTGMLTANDIRDLLSNSAAAIELDQIRVDAMPPEEFHPLYDEGMWRHWRRGHLDYIDHLLPTVDAIPPSMLRELTQLAVTCKPEIVREAVIDVLCDAMLASDNWAEDGLETAALFFGQVIKQVRDWPDGRAKGARNQIMHWLPVKDPLRIARDPECGYEGLIPDGRH